MLFTPLVSGCASYGFVCDFDFFKLMYSDKEKKDMYDVWVESVSTISDGSELMDQSSGLRGLQI